VVPTRDLQSRSSLRREAIADARPARQGQAPPSFGRRENWLSMARRRPRRIASPRAHPQRALLPRLPRSLFSGGCLTCAFLGLLGELVQSRPVGLKAHLPRKTAKIPRLGQEFGCCAHPGVPMDGGTHHGARTPRPEPLFFPFAGGCAALRARPPRRCLVNTAGRLRGSAEACEHMRVGDPPVDGLNQAEHAEQH